MTDTTKQTPLYAWHAAHGGKMVEFGGWMMPLHYQAGIVGEHHATRKAIGLFDISHMGRAQFFGAAAPQFLSRVTTKDASAIEQGKVRYALVCHESGGVVDDVLIFHQTGVDAHQCYWLVVNASNTPKVYEVLSREAGPFTKTSPAWADRTDDYAMFAVQGPRSLELVRKLVVADVAAMKYYTTRSATIAGAAGFVSRTGYTGEDGFELILPAERAVHVWEQLVKEGEPYGLLPAGLGCRDTLRLEAGMPLYGHELSDTINPYQAGLGFAVDLERAPFLGQAALKTLSQDVRQPVRVGLMLPGRRIPRQGYAVTTVGDSPQAIGEVTSGSHSPTLNKPIAMAYIDRAHAKVGTQVAIDIRGQAEPAEVVRVPFYKKPKPK